LCAHPIKFEAVSYKHGNFGHVLVNEGCQRLDPRVELLLGKFLCELVYAALPKALPEFKIGAVVGVGMGALGHCAGQLLWIVVVCCEADSNLSILYPHSAGRVAQFVQKNLIRP